MAYAYDSETNARTIASFYSTYKLQSFENDRAAVLLSILDAYLSALSFTNLLFSFLTYMPLPIITINWVLLCVYAILLGLYDM